MFRPNRQDRVIDQAITNAQIGRTVIGTLATLWLIYAYPLRDSMGEVASDKFEEVIFSATILFVSAPMALLVFVLAARPPVRRLYLRRSLQPLKALGAIFAAFAFVIFFGTHSGSQLLASVPLLSLLLAPVVLFVIPFALTGAALSATTVFRTADVHEVLPPLISPVLVCAMFVIQLFDSPPVEAPFAVRLLFLIGPPVSVLVLSFWELRRLRTHHHLTVRAALNRGTGQ